MEKEKNDVLLKEPGNVLQREKVDENSYKMEEKKVSLIKAANYFVQLFYKTGQRYTCTQTKIGKLLSILAFLYARENTILFEEKIRKYDGCGTAINELKKIITEIDVYLHICYFDGEDSITEKLDDTLFDPSKDEALKKYADVTGLSQEVKDRIEDVFRRFGAFSAYKIGQLMNPIVNRTEEAGSEGVIDLTKIAKLKKEDFDQQNSLIQFLFSD